MVGLEEQVTLMRGDERMRTREDGTFRSDRSYPAGIRRVNQHEDFIFRRKSVKRPNSA